MSELFYTSPASIWEEALPIGNGRLGAMIFGGVEMEHLQVNEETMWYGGEVNRLNPDAREHLEEVRELLKNGEISKAQQLLSMTFTACPNSAHPYQTLGDVNIYFDPLEQEIVDDKNQLQKRKLEIKDYQRGLDLETATSFVQFRAGDTMYRREYFASRPGDAIVVHMTAEGSGTLNFSVQLGRDKYFDGLSREDNNGISLYGNLGQGGSRFAMTMKASCANDEKAPDASLNLKAPDASLNLKAPNACINSEVLHDCINSKAPETRAESPQIKLLGEYLVVSRAKEVTLVFGAKTSFWEKDLTTQKLQQQLSASLNRLLQKSYEDSKEQHITDYQSLYKRVELQLWQGNGDADTVDNESAQENRTPLNFPTNQRLEAVVAGKTDLGLEKLLFDYGRYLLISCSRPGNLPANLQGIWNKDFMPPWDSKYTININAQMNYWPAEYCNLPECHEPLFDLLERVRVNGHKTAREMYGCRGSLAHHNTDIYGDTAPQDLWLPATFWTQGEAWLATHIWTHYSYTKDIEFLKRCFPILVDCSLFYVDFLTEYKGYMVTNPSVSPENTYILPNGEKGCVCIGPTMDNQILRDVFTMCLDSYDVLRQVEESEKAEASEEANGSEKTEMFEMSAGTEKIKAFEMSEMSEEIEKAQESSKIGLQYLPEGVEDLAQLMEQIRELRSKLAPTQIGSDGRIMEWLEEYREEEPGHRHISHLYGLYPSNQISVTGTPELAEAARKTLKHRLSFGGGHTGWSRAWIMNHYAKLWDGEKARENIVKMLAQSTYPNMFDKHPPFQIDGNFGACAAIAQMLVQSTEKEIYLLPALPSAWENGSIKGLKVVGNATVDLAWKQGKLSSFSLHAGSPIEVMVIYKNNATKVKLQAGQTYVH